MRAIDALDAIAASVRTRGYPPTVREIGDKLGLRSTSSVHHHLLVCRRKGWISVEPDKPRAIRITDAGLEALRKRAAL